MLLFKSDENFGPTVTRVDVWHAATMIHRGNDIHLSGQRYADQIFAGENIFDVNHGGITWGVAISVRLASPSADEAPPMQFIAAGADFDLPS